MLNLSFEIQYVFLFIESIVLVIVFALFINAVLDYNKLNLKDQNEEIND